MRYPYPMRKGMDGSVYWATPNAPLAFDWEGRQFTEVCSVEFRDLHFTDTGDLTFGITRCNVTVLWIMKDGL